MVADAGHEIGAHGYSHENPISMTPKQEEDVLARCVEVIGRLSGKKPRGYVAPWWEFSPVTTQLLLKHEFTYDHSLMHRDFECYYVRTGDSWTKIDYSKPAAAWMKPLVRGEVEHLVLVSCDVEVAEAVHVWSLLSDPITRDHDEIIRRPGVRSHRRATASCLRHPADAAHAAATCRPGHRFNAAIGREGAAADILGT